MYVYVMDYAGADISRIEIEDNYDDSDIETILKKYGFTLDCVSYMYCDDELEINELN